MQTMKTTQIFFFAIVLSYSGLIKAEKLLCLPDTTMQISSTSTETGRVRQTSKNTRIFTKSHNNISLLLGKNKIDFKKLDKYVYTSEFGIIILHPENNLRIIVNAFRPDNVKEQISIETTVYDCNVI